MALFDDIKPVQVGKRLPWEKQQREGLEAFEYFQYYLSLATRDVAAVASKFDIAPAFMQDVAKKYSWVSRANAYDHNAIAVEAQIIPAHESAVMDMAEKHIVLARQAQQVAATGLQILNQYLKEAEFAKQTGSDLPPKPFLKAEEIVKLGKFGIDIERLSMGEATSKTESKVDFGRLSDDELQQLLALSDKAEGSDD
jgi:hypothetical protein